MNHEEKPANPAPCHGFSAEELEAALAGALAEARAGQLADHLDQCQACQGRMDTILATLSGQIHSDNPSIEIPDPAADSILARLRVDPPSIDDYRPGDYIGPYQVMALLGKGGSSTVYECYDQQMARNVAVKLLTHHSFLDSHLARHEREARVLAQLDHPWIVKAFEIKPFEFPPYIVMELVAGGPSDLLVKSGTIKPRQAARLVAGVARAVQHAHEHGILHRDIKPSNLLVVQPFDPLKPLPDEIALKVSDFGLARPMGGDSRLTSTMAILGTPAYMSPEQARGRQSEIGPASDIYAIGVVLYEYLIGRPPLQADNAIETLRLVNEAEPIPPRHVQPGIPLDLDTICLKCLRKAPAERYATARELAEDLERFLEGRPILARPIGRLQRLYRWGKRNRPLAAALGGILVLLSSLVALAGTFAILQNDLRQQAEANATLYKQAAQEASYESDFARTLFFGGVQNLDNYAAKLKGVRQIDELPEIASNARLLNQEIIGHYANRAQKTNGLHGEDIDKLFRDAIAIKHLNYEADANKMFRELVTLGTSLPARDPDYARARRVALQSSTILAFDLRAARKSHDAVVLLQDVQKKLNIDFSPVGEDSQGVAILKAFLDTLIDGLRETGLKAEADSCEILRVRLLSQKMESLSPGR